MKKVYCNRNCINYKCERHKAQYILLDVTDEKVYYHTFDNCVNYKPYRQVTQHKYDLKQLCSLTKMSEKVLKLYMCRAEFSHIIFIKPDKIYKNITQEDIERLKYLRERRSNGKNNRDNRK